MLTTGPPRYARLPMPRVLIVEDQPPVAKALALLLDLNGIDSAVEPDADGALTALADGRFDVVIQDMNFAPGATSGEEGIALFRSIRASHPELPVLLLTAFTSLETAVQLIEEGASDYLSKPWDDTKLITAVRNLVRMAELASENRSLHDQRRRARDELRRRFDLGGLVYASDAMHEVVSLAV